MFLLQIMQPGKQYQYDKIGYGQRPVYDFPRIEYERRVVPRSDMGGGPGKEKSDQSRWYRDGERKRRSNGDTDNGGIYFQQNGFDWRHQSSQSPSGIDNHRYSNMSPGLGRGVPFRLPPAMEMKSGSTGGDEETLKVQGPDSQYVGSNLQGGGIEKWQNTDEEEYVWEDLTLQAQEQEGLGRGNSRVEDQYSGEGTLGRGQMHVSHSSGAPYNLSWQRPRGNPQSQQFPLSADNQSILHMVGLQKNEKDLS